MGCYAQIVFLCTDSGKKDCMRGRKRKGWWNKLNAHNNCVRRDKAWGVIELSVVFSLSLSFFLSTLLFKHVFCCGRGEVNPKLPHAKVTNNKNSSSKKPKRRTSKIKKAAKEAAGNSSDGCDGDRVLCLRCHFISFRSAGCCCFFSSCYFFGLSDSERHEQWHTTHTHTHTHSCTGWLDRKREVGGGTGEEVSEGGWEVCARNRRQGGQPIPLDCIFFSFSACRGRVTLYVCVCLTVLVCVTIHQHCVERRRRRLRRRRRWLGVLLFEIRSRIVVAAVVGLVYFMCVCVCVHKLAVRVSCCCCCCRIEFGFCFTCFTFCHLCSCFFCDLISLFGMFPPSLLQYFNYLHCVWDSQLINQLVRCVCVSFCESVRVSLFVCVSEC